MNKKEILGAALLVLVGVSVYLWTSDKGPNVDTRLAANTEHYVCPKCQHEFDLTNAESTAMFRAGGIKCPSCQEIGDSRMKSSVEVYIGGLAFQGGSNEEGTNSEEAAETAGELGRLPVPH